jgi:site-specific recombinase XerD
MYIDIAFQKFEDHAIFIRGLAKPTLAGYRKNLEFYFRDRGIIRTEDITEENVRAFLFNGRAIRGWKPNTYLNHYKSFNVFIKWCIENDCLSSENFMDKVKKIRVGRLLPKALKKDDTVRLLDVVHNYPYRFDFIRYRNYAIFAIAIYAGLRKKEILNLQCVDVSMEGYSLFVREGKGGKDRIIPMSTSLANILKLYEAERRRHKKTCPEYFASFNTNRGISDGCLKHIVDHIKLASGVKFSLHKLRHTFATLMVEGGCDIYSLSKMMGHSDITTTTIYLSASAEHLRGQIFKHPLN